MIKFFSILSVIFLLPLHPMQAASAKPGSASSDDGDYIAIIKSETAQVKEHIDDFNAALEKKNAEDAARALYNMRNLVGDEGGVLDRLYEYDPKIYSALFSQHDEKKEIAAIVTKLKEFIEATYLKREDEK